MNNFFTANLQIQDSEIFTNLEKELERQRNNLELIASENIVSRAVLEALGTIPTNKYAEGYPGKRYYGGCKYVDEIENLAIERAKKLFKASYVNVQPHSGSQANQAVFFALLNPGDSILGMSLNEGGHLTHGAAPNISGRWFKATSYGVNQNTGFINYDEVEEIALKCKPKLIIAGGSAYPRIIDFKRFKEIANKVGALLLADIAHYAGLICSDLYPSPMEYADIITTTTHKTLRGPRGGMILSNNLELGKKINSAIFPGIQGGPIMNIIASKAVAFGEALTPEFKEYSKKVLSNCKSLASILMTRGYKLVTDGTDSHLLLIDLSKNNLTGKEAEKVLEDSGITCNKNTVPAEKLSPFITSGIRLGTPACTTRGLTEADFKSIGNIIADVLDSMLGGNIQEIQGKAKIKIKEICAKYPIYPYLK